MLKWTVSRPLSTAVSTPHGTIGSLGPQEAQSRTPRRPFGDLSNTPPTHGGKARALQNSTIPIRPTPARRRRCRSHGSDLRSYFQATKPNLRSGCSKRQSVFHQGAAKNDKVESFYQSTPRVDADIGPLTLSLYPVSETIKRSTALTLPSNPSLMKVKNFQSNAELPQNLLNEARANLQSHVSDFFQQISVAASPEDLMETETVPLSKRLVYPRSCDPSKTRFASDFNAATPCVPKLAKITKLQNHCDVPYHRARSRRDPRRSKEPCKDTGSCDTTQTPLAARLSHLKLDQDLPNFENMDNTVTEVLQKEMEITLAGRTVAEILLQDSEERRKARMTVGTDSTTESALGNIRTSCETMIDPVEGDESVCETLRAEETVARHNDSTVSSASQLLEDPSPVSWATHSPSYDLDGRFTLRRQRGIRRKRTAGQRKDATGTDVDEESRKKRAKRRSLSLSPKTTAVSFWESATNEVCEAVNFEVNKCILETDLDASYANKSLRLASGSKESLPQSLVGTQLLQESSSSSGHTRETHCWEPESPKSPVNDDFQSSRSFLTSVSSTPEAPLVATVRRCLKYSPEGENPHLRPSSRGSIEIEVSTLEDHIRVHVIRCKDLRRAYEGPIHAYVKATLKKPNGEATAVKRTAVHRATPRPTFQETLILPCTTDNNNSTGKPASLDIAVWNRDRRARRSELLGCMTLPLPLSQDKEATWHPLEAGSGRNTSTPYAGAPQDCGVSPPLSKDGDPEDNNNSAAEDLTYLRHLELEPMDPATGLPLNPGFTARGGRTPCTATRRLSRPNASNQQVPWGFSLSWGKPPRVERVDTGSPADRAGLKSGDYVVFVETTNVVTGPREEILNLIQAASGQLLLEIYRKGGAPPTTHRASTVTVTLQTTLPQLPNSVNPTQHTVAFTTEAFASLAPGATPEEELSLRETRYWGSLKSGLTRFITPLAERRDILSATDHSILFQNLDELLKMSGEIRDEGGGVDSYLRKISKITAAYRRYLSGLQRACCLLVALRRNSAFAKLVCEPAVPQKRKPDLTGLLLLPLEHYREMTRLVTLTSPRNCQEARDLSQGYREATANAGVMEPPRHTGRPLLSLQEVESRLVFARCKPFNLAIPGRQWLFGGALAKVEGRGRPQASWGLLLTDLLVFARVSRDRVLFVTEEPLRLSSIAEACFTVRKRPTEFRLQIAVSAGGLSGDNGNPEYVNTSGCSPHGRPRRRVLVLRAPSPELKAVWHNLLQRQIIYVNTGYGGTPGLGSPVDDAPAACTGSNFTCTARDSLTTRQVTRSTQHLVEETDQRPGESLATILKSSTRDNNHLAQWVRNSHQIPPPDPDGPLEEWTAEELAARAPVPKETDSQRMQGVVPEEIVTISSDVEQQSSASSASLSTVRSNSQKGKKKEGNHIASKENCTGSGCPPPPVPRDPFSPLPPKISVLPPTPDLCTRHRLHNGPNDSPSHTNSPNCTPADGNTEDGSEDDLDCEGEPPYRALRRFGTMSSLDQDDELDEQPDEENHDLESPPSGLRAWTVRASNYVVSKMVLFEQFGEGVGGYLSLPPVPPERTEFSSLDANDEEGTTSGATSGDEIWGTPTSGGPDDESFAASPPPGNAFNAIGEDNQGLDDDDEADQDSDNEDSMPPDLSMDQLLVGGSINTLRCFVARRRLEPLPEEEDSTGSGKQQVGWW